MSSKMSSQYYSHPHVPWYRQLLNLMGCLLIIPLYRASLVNTFYPSTFELLFSIVLAEFCRYKNAGRRTAFRELESQPTRYKDDVEKNAHHPHGGVLEAQGGPGASSCDTVAFVVGWREDPVLWQKCLESYKTAVNCRFLIAGVDGHDADDQEMVDVFKKVFPERSGIIHLDEPLGEIANAVCRQERAMRQKLGDDAVDEDEINEIAMQTCIGIVRQKLEEHLGGSALSGPGGIKQLLVHQRHLHKKGIMFTNFIFSIVIADLLGLEFVWTSDSDSMVNPDSVEGTISTIAGDPNVGGASSGLAVHNATDNAVTRMASVVYWCELYITRSLPGLIGKNDCQSGPCAAFRLSAIRPLLVPWYNQKIFGKRMIVNEDRHLTSLLLLRGWGIIYAADVMTTTETPTTTVRWLRQQVRWARAQHIESLLYPRAYIVNHPFLFLSALKRELTHIIIFIQGMLYIFSSEVSLVPMSMLDLAARIFGLAIYGFLRNPARQSAKAVFWMVPGLLFYNVPLPAVQVWSLITLTADTWGNSMRSSSERVKKDSLGKKWYEAGFVIAWMGAVGIILAKWFSLRVDLIAHHLHLVEALAAISLALATWKFTIRDA